MRNYLLLALLIFGCCFVSAQTQWSNAIQITTGSGQDRDVACVNTAPLYPLMTNVEWLAFSRDFGSTSAICVLTTVPSTRQWSDSTIIVFRDSARNRYPAFARSADYPVQSELMLVWSRIGLTNELYFSRNAGGVWSVPQAIVSSPRPIGKPHVAVSDSTFGLTWEIGGQIFHSEFRTGAWSIPERVTSINDTTNSSPQTRFIGGSSPEKPVVVWERRKTVDTSHAIYYSVRSASGWVTTDTVAFTGDNRNPRFFKLGFWGYFGLSWENIYQAKRSIYGVNAMYDGSGISRNLIWEMFSDPTADFFGASFSIIPIITDGSQPGRYTHYTAGTWQRRGIGRDSIVVIDFHGRFLNYRTAGSVGFDQSPDITAGSSGIMGARYWSIWESNATGQWKLFGSFADVPLSVENDGSPTSIRLLQNYPNPFNPSTTCRYTLTGMQQVSLKVFDLLGREIATLVNERKEPGSYEATWNSQNAPTGVYFLRMIAGDRVQVKKAILLK